MLLGIIEPDAGSRTLLGRDRPIDAAYQIGYLPEERGLYPAMTTREAVAFLGSLRGLPLSESRRRADRLLEANGMGEVARRPIRTLSKGMAQTVQLLGTFIHQPKLIVLDEPFSGLDPLNQQGLEELIRAERQRGATILFSTHVMAHAERLCESPTIIGDGKVRFSGTVEAARATLRARVHLVTPPADGPCPAALPADAVRHAGAPGSPLINPHAGIKTIPSTFVQRGPLYRTPS